MSTKYHNGAFTFFRTTSACQPMLPSEIEHLAQQHSLPASLIPQYAGDRAIVSRAITQTASKVSRQGWLLRPISQTKHKVVYGIVQEARDEERERLDHTHEATVTWTDEYNKGHSIITDHIGILGQEAPTIGQAVETAYQSLRGRIGPADWTATISAHLTQTYYAQQMREDGRVWWLPPSGIPQARQLQGFLQAVGISLVLCEVEAEAVSVVQQAAQESLADQLQALQDEVAAFDGKQKPSNYRNRMAEIVELRKRAVVYHETLSVGVEQAQAILDELERQVREFLDVRENTVIHRKGTVSAVGTPGSGQVDTFAAAFGGMPSMVTQSQATFSW